MVNCIRIDKSNLNQATNVYDLLKMAGIRPSISKLDKLAKMGALRLNDLKVDPGNLNLMDYPLLAQSVYIVKSGKKEYYTIILD